jgi:hypothetical protein
MRKALLALTLVALMGCGSSSSGNDQETNIQWDAVPEEATVQEVAPEVGEEAYVPTGQGKLEFVDQFGDDQKTCIQTDTCSFTVSYNSERGLKVRYTENGQPKEGAPIKFQVIEDQQQAGKLAVSTVYSVASGVAEAKVKVVKAVETTFKVKVFLQGTDVTPIYFKINAQPKIDSSLTVSATYNGQQTFTGVKAYLFKNDSLTEPSKKCADMDPRDLPTADYEKGPVDLAQTFKWAVNELLGLEDEGEQFYTVVARAEKEDGTAVAFGCDDSTGHVFATSSRHVTVAMKDIAPSIVGSYEIETQLDLVSALPQNVADPVNLVLDFFEQPVASILKLICKIDNASMQDMCGWVFNTPGDPDVNDLTTLGGVILDIMDAFLEAYITQWTGTNIIGIGDDIRDMIKELKLIATFDINAEPDEFGFIPPDKTHASWHTISVRWTYGQNCQPGDENCGKINLSLNSIGQQAVVANFGATLTYDGQVSYLTIGGHSITIKYGALINHLLQKYVLPRLLGDGSDGKPVVDSYEKLFKSMLGGGKECLAPSAQQPGCCEVFVSSTLNASGGVGQAALQTACETLITLGATYVEAQLTNLDLSTGDNTTLATREGIPCKLYDLNADTRIDAWGKKEPADQRCVWDLKLKFKVGSLDVDTAVQDNSFFGSLAQ